jgi:maltokinase
MAVPPAEPGFLAPWMVHQRWFANKGTLPALEEIGRFELPGADPGVGIGVHLLLDHTKGKPLLYQVPLTYRRTPLPGAEAAMVGMLGSTYVYDGPHDPAFPAALLAVIAGDLELDGDRTWAKGRCTTPELATDYRSRVLTGEQSNTSIVFESQGGAPPVICKLFRALHHGDNPDVELQTALAAAGCDTVPHSVGHLVADWSDRGRAGGRARGHLAFVQEFLPGARDAWRLALDAAAAGRAFAAEARAIGIATAGVHATLAASMPTAPTGRVVIDAAVEQMRGRLAAAIAEVPGLGRHAASIGAIFDAARASAWPAAQRIHGDLHLGQLLDVPGRGWVIVDFEGEPLRPMAERCVADSPLRDVASMLRSLDYVTGALSVQGRPAPVDWSAGARAGFELGYAEASGCDPREHRALVDALELDKALYEVVYESRNRPTWTRIPVEAIERIGARSLA